MTRADSATELPGVRRILVSTIWFSFVLALVFWMRVGGRFALGYAIGTLWGILNFWFLREVVVHTITLEERRVDRILWRLLVKFPLLYGVGIWILLSGIVPILALVIGFSMVLIVMVLKALGRKLTGQDLPGHIGPPNV